MENSIKQVNQGIKTEALFNAYRWINQGRPPVKTCCALFIVPN